MRYSSDSDDSEEEDDDIPSTVMEVDEVRLDYAREKYDCSDFVITLKD